MKSEFRSKLQAEEVDELKGVDKLIIPLRYYSEFLECEIEAPAGFHTDYASVPRLPFAYMVVGGKGRKGAVLHDLLYSGFIIPALGRALTRKECDTVFAEALRASGYNEAVVMLMYAGVRAGGSFSFNRKNVPQQAHVAVQLNQPTQIIASDLFAG